MMHTVCVFCGSSMGNHELYKTAAEALGKILAQKKMTLVYGGADVGLMKVLADACLQACGNVTGVMPYRLIDKEIAHQRIQRLHAVDTMAQRKELMVELSDAFIALPGGFGTLDELSEILTFNQLRISDKPLGLLNTNGYFDLLLQFFDKGVAEGFVRKEHRENIVVSDSIEELLQRLALWQPIETQKWIEDIKTESKM